MIKKYLVNIYEDVGILSIKGQLMYNPFVVKKDRRELHREWVNGEIYSFLKK
jgi:hypothetical protein